jgi:hypothetical protein
LKKKVLVLKKIKIYDLFETHDCLEDAEESIKTMNESPDEAKWVRSFKHKTLNGEKRYYRCRKGCRKLLYCLLHSNSQEVSIFISNDDHHHKENNYNLHPASKKKVEELLKLRVTSITQILQHLREENLPELKRSQINNLKARTKTKIYGSSQCNLIDLINWCEENNKIPEDNDKVFVGGFKHKIKENNKIKYLRIFLTTKRLINYVTYSRTYFSSLLFCLFLIGLINYLFLFF